MKVEITRMKYLKSIFRTKISQYENFIYLDYFIKRTRVERNILKDIIKQIASQFI